MSRVTKPLKAPTAGIPAKPSGLSELAAAEWDRLTGELQEAGIMVTVAHRAALTLAATVAADIKDAWKHVEADGAYISTKAGLVAHPASKRIDALRRDYIKVLTVLGLRAAVASGVSDEESLEDVIGS
jgi:phage terminase small subunit